MSLPALRLVGAEVLTPDGLQEQPLVVADGLLVPDCAAREVDLSGFVILAGIVDLHGDGFERHLAPRRGAMKDLGQGLVAAEAEIAANGITTAVFAQFYSWEGGMRGPAFAERMFAALGQVRRDMTSDLRAQLRFETSLIEDYDAVGEMIARNGIGYVVFNDHLPHEALAQGKRPPRLTGQALRIGRSPERHLDAMQALHARRAEIPRALSGLTARLMMQGVAMGSHDDKTAAQRREWHGRGVRIAEFPETLEAIQAAGAVGDAVIMGAPNVVRGGSHNGNIGATEVVKLGLCAALASDYHYPSLRHAAFMLVDSGVIDLAGAWSLISSGPAKILGLADRGELSTGKRADLVMMDKATRQIGTTIAGGRISYLSGEAAARFLR